MENTIATPQHSSGTQRRTPEVQHFLQTSARYLQLPQAAAQPVTAN
ncbi:MAG: hypothetical protein PVI50_02595 [Gammaproteobacteria bacterium]|jgi:hypothetical protein